MRRLCAFGAFTTVLAVVACATSGGGDDAPPGETPKEAGANDGATATAVEDTSVTDTAISPAVRSPPRR